MAFPWFSVTIALLVAGVLAGGVAWGVIVTRPGPTLRVTEGPTATPRPTGPPAPPGSIALYVGPRVNGDFLAQPLNTVCGNPPCEGLFFPVACTSFQPLSGFAQRIVAPSSAPVVDPNGNVVADSWGEFAAQGANASMVVTLFWSGCSQAGVAVTNCNDFSSIDGQGEVGGLFAVGTQAFDLGKPAACNAILPVLCGCYQP